MRGDAFISRNGKCYGLLGGGEGLVVCLKVGLRPSPTVGVNWHCSIEINVVRSVYTCWESSLRCFSEWTFNSCSPEFLPYGTTWTSKASI